MSDLERLLRSSLEEVGNAYSPRDTAGAKERFLKRRRRRTFRIAVSGVAVTAAAVAAALFVFSTSSRDEDVPLPTAAAPQPVATIGVSDEPISAVAGPGGVWVVERGSGTLSLIDPESNEVSRSVSIGKNPDEVVAGDNGIVWVAHEDGSITRLFTEAVGSRSSQTFALAQGSEVHLDLAVTPHALVAVEPDSGSIFEVADSPESPQDSISVSGDGGIEAGPRYAGRWAATDVAYGPAGLWFLDGTRGEIRTRPSLRADGDSLEDSVGQGEVFGIDSVPGGEMADLAVGTDAVWIANGTGGHLYGIDLGTGDGTSQVGVELEVGGRYTDLAIGGGYVWALTGGDGPSVLRMIDESTGEVVGDPLTMGGRPTDVAYAGGSAWVTDGDGAQVIRVNPSEIVEPIELTPDDQAHPLVDPDDVVFVYSERDDLFAETFEGDRVQLTDTPKKYEINPTMSSDGELIYEDEQQGLIRLDLATGKSQDLGKGSVPSFGPDGRFAWVINNRVDGTEILVGPPGGEPTRSVSVEDCSSEPGGPPDPSQLCPMVVRNITWSADGSALYYEAGWEFGFALYELSLNQEPLRQFDLGEAAGYEASKGSYLYTAPSTADSGSVTLVRTCCHVPPERPATSAGLGRINFTEASPDYEELLPLDALDATSSEWYVASLGTLSREADGWVEGQDRSWLVSDSVALWYVSEGGALKLLREPGPDSHGSVHGFRGVTAPIR